MERAREALKEGEDLIAARQKAIRIADRSEYGWATVEEYEEDELAANSDDEKNCTELRCGLVGNVRLQQPRARKRESC